ncbi:MAG TPA: FAD-dependent oxidoreductase [Kiloniellales bacterium]|nr:FAD-dependent oxidoreductase [Kiloniellales bacterium]
MGAAVRAVLVVGAGFAGAVHARELAEAGWPVQVIDRRDHLAGTAYDWVDATGTRRHAYGPHLFHTRNARVMAWLCRFGAFLPYELRVRALVEGLGCLPLPINRTTINAVFGLMLRDAAEVAAFLASEALPCAAPRNAAEHLHARVGVRLTNLFYRPYSTKMWGRPLERLDPEVVARVPIRHDDEDRYFLDAPFQLLPRDGYVALIAAILDHPSIRVSTGTAFDPAMLAEHEACFTSMAIDEFYGACHGPLPYRSLRFHHREVECDYGLGETALVTFTDPSPYTRQTDWSRLPGHRVGTGARKTVTLEEPCDSRDNGDERFYPVRDRASDALYRQYAALAERDPKLRFIGRCGTYRYLDMDQVINQSLHGVRKWIREHG